MVVAFDSAFEPLALKKWLRKLEYACGRSRRQTRFSNRTLDMDIVLAGNLVLHYKNLRLPRPELIKRAYVLKPLYDLAPDLIHPETSQKIADIWYQMDSVEADSIKLVDSLGWFI